MKIFFALALFSLMGLHPSLAWALPTHQYQFLASCEGWVSPSGSTPFNITIEGYVDDSQFANSSINDRRGLAVLTHQTTNNFITKTAESAIVRFDDTAAGPQVRIRTDTFPNCDNCFDLKIKRPGGPGTTSGTLFWDDSSTTATLTNCTISK